VDRRGGTEPVKDGDPARVYNSQSVALSPDDARLAVAFPPDGETQVDLWVMHLAGRYSTLLRTGPFSDRRPVWHDGGRRIAYIGGFESGATEIRSISASGEGSYEVLVPTRPVPINEFQFTPNERGLVYREGDSTTGVGNIGFIDLDGGDTVPDIVPSAFVERGIALSNDGRWLAYVSDSNGNDQVFVRPFGSAGERVQISIDGGTEPVWADNGRELFYREPSTGWMMVANLATAPTINVNGRERLFDASSFMNSGGAWRAYDVTRDGQRFVMIRAPMAGSDAPRITVIQNFLSEVDRRVN
jgi:Tol biopolymer transport system component